MGYPVSAVRGKNFGGAAVPLSLLPSLIAYWPGNEASGNLLDAHTGGLNLADNGTVTSNPGLVYALARQYTAVTNEYHSIADNAPLSMGDVDMTLAALVYLDSKGTSRPFVSKWNFSVASREYYLFFNNAADRFAFAVSKDGASGASSVTATANSLGSPSLATWYWIVAQHDAVNNTVSIQVDNGAVDSVAWANGIYNGGSPFEIGRLIGDVSMNGRIGPTMLWKSAPGGGGVLSAVKLTALWNGGTPLQYSQL